MNVAAKSASMGSAIAGEMELFRELRSLHSVLRSELPNSPFLEAGVTEAPDSLTGNGTGLHATLNPDLMDGELDIYRVFPGLSVSIVRFRAKDVDAIHEIASRAVSEEHEITVRLFQQGKVVYRFGDHVVDSEVTPGVLSLKTQQGRSGYELRAGESIRITILVISEEGEREVWHRLGIAPPPLFQQLRSADDPDMRVFALPSTEAFRHFSSSLRCLPDSGMARAIYLRMKVGEFFCLLNDLHRPEDEHANAGVPGSEFRKLARAKEILDELDGDSPGIAALSTAVGLNRRKLTEGFKRVYGETVAGYALEVRMRKGYQLLKESPLPVREIAERCGYEHSSNFTIAFRRRFGNSPSVVRTHN